jgi:hypothetical protein
MTEIEKVIQTGYITWEQWQEIFPSTCFYDPDAKDDKAVAEAPEI